MSPKQAWVRFVSIRFRHAQRQCWQKIGSNDKDFRASSNLMPGTTKVSSEFFVPRWVQQFEEGIGGKETPYDVNESLWNTSDWRMQRTRENVTSRCYLQKVWVKKLLINLYPQHVHQKALVGTWDLHLSWSVFIKKRRSAKRDDYDRAWHWKCNMVTSFLMNQWSTLTYFLLNLYIPHGMSLSLLAGRNQMK